MKAKPKARVSRAGERRAAKPTVAAKPTTGTWRASDLPLDLQIELRDAIEQADRGEDLHDFDDAMKDAERMSDEMLAVLSRDAHRSA